MADWFTYFNVQVRGLSPFHINWLKTPLLILCGCLFLWALLSPRVVPVIRTLEDRINRLGEGAQHAFVWGLGFAFAACLVFVRVLQFYQLQTNWDTGVEANVAWHMVHGPLFFNSLDNRSALSQHFAPVWFVSGLLYRVWQSPLTLLALQSVAVGLGVVPVYFLTLQRGLGPFHGFLMIALYAFNWFLHVNNAHDYHRPVLAIPVLLWLMYAVEVNRKGVATALAALSLTIEESLGLVLVGVGLYVLAMQRAWRWWGAAIAATGLGYFLLVTKVIMPELTPEGVLFLWARYAHLGSDLIGAVANLLLHPVWAVDQALFRHNQFIRVLYLLGSLAFLPLLGWRQSLVATIPLGMMLLSGKSGQYNLGHHYAAPALPFLFYGAIYGLKRVTDWLHNSGTRSVPRWKAVTACLLICFGWNMYRVPNYDLDKTSDVFAEAAFEAIRQVPAEVSLATEGRFTPFLANLHRLCKVSWNPQHPCDWMPIGLEVTQSLPPNSTLPLDPTWEPEYILIGTDMTSDAANESQKRKTFAAALSAKEGRYEVIAGHSGIFLLRLKPLNPVKGR